MDKLLKGIVKFKQEDFEKHRKLFEEIGRSQKPHTLFITCSDSRVDPNLITNTLPGELFIIRNIANIVPPYRKSEEYLATTSAIEYAVEALNVENIIVCGHSNCGGCSSLYLNDSEFALMPHTRKWLELAKKVKDMVLAYTLSNDEAAREWLTEQMNVVEQIKHLLSYPFIREKFEKNQIQINGWYYIIETGEIYAYNKEKEFFEIIN